MRCVQLDKDLYKKQQSVLRVLKRRWSLLQQLLQAVAPLHSVNDSSVGVERVSPAQTLDYDRYHCQTACKMSKCKCAAKWKCECKCGGFAFDAKGAALAHLSWNLWPNMSHSFSTSTRRPARHTMRRCQSRRRR